MRLEIYCDGACPANGHGGKRMGCGVYACFGERWREFSKTVDDERASNNLAELLAIELALVRVNAQKRRGVQLLVFSDSEWAVKGINGVYRLTAHVELVKRIRGLLAEFGSWEVTWLRGHIGHRYQERANTLAQAAARGGDGASGSRG